MAKEDKGEGKKDDSPKGEGGDKQKAPKEGKGGGGGKAKAGKKGGPVAPKGDVPIHKRTAKPSLKNHYETTVIKNLMTEFGYANVMEVPRIVKVTINMGLGEAVGNAKIVDSAVEELRLITGQQPVVTRAKKAIANFKLREGQKIGAMVTLRRERMWEFLERLISFALPRVRDFKGISPRAFDGRGNYSLGVREQIIFPEIDYDNIEKIQGMNISITTTARNDDEGRALLQHLGMPFRKQVAQ